MVWLVKLGRPGFFGRAFLLSVLIVRVWVELVGHLFLFIIFFGLLGLG